MRRFSAIALAMVSTLATGGVESVVQPTPPTISAPENAAFNRLAAQFAVSPDGRSVLFAAVSGGRTALWIQALGSATATRLSATDGASYPFWSPNGQSIGFFAEGKLQTAPAAGGSALALCDAPDGRGGAWSPEGSIIFTPSPADALVRVPAEGGACVPFTRLAASERSHRWPQFLPDGRHFIFLVTSRANAASSDLRIGSLDSSDVVPVGVHSDSSATYGADHVLFTRNSSLMALKIDLHTLRAIGEPFAVARRVRTDANFYTAVSVSATGVLLSQQDKEPRTTRLTWMDRTGDVLGTIGDAGQYMNIALAPNDRRIAVSVVSGTPENRDIWVIDSERNTAVRITADAANDAVPLWSQNGRSMVFESYRTGLPSIFRTASDRAITETQLVKSSFRDIPEDWSADGRFVAFTRETPETILDLWILPLGGSRTAFPFRATAASEDNARFHPSGKWIAYASNTTGRYEVYVRPFRRGEGEYRVSRNGGSSPLWRHDGKELFFLSSDGTLMAAPIDVTAGFRSGEPALLFRTGMSDVVMAQNRHQYAVTRDGRRFLINRAEPHDESPPLRVVRNWNSP